MGIFRRSLCEDKIDHYHHTWSVLFLIVLALVTWLLPLSLDLQAKAWPSKVVVSQGTEGLRTPQIGVNCWCPREFTSAMVAYTLAACGSAYKLALDGQDRDENEIGATLYIEPSFDEILPQSAESTRFRPNMAQKPRTNSQTKDITVDLPQAEEKQQKDTDDAWYFIHTKTPCMLFLLAVCLKIPHLVWALLATTAGGINIDQTLRSAQTGTRLDGESRRQLYRELAGAAEKARACSCGTSCVYLLVKTLMCVAVIGGLLVVHGSLLPEAKSLEDKLHQKDRNEDMIELVQTALKNATEERRKISVDDYYRENSNKLLMCSISIRQLQNVQNYMVQCIFYAEKVATSTQNAGELNLPTESSVGMVRLYETIFLIVQTLLVLLTVLDVTGLLVWLLKLLTPCCKTVVSDLDLPLDACLLLQMAQENVGPEVVSGLAHNGAWGRNGGEESMAMNE